MKTLALFCTIIALVTVAVAQGPDTLWTRTYGGSSRDWALSIRQTTDGGYVVFGYTESFGAGGGDSYMVKTDGQGDTLWTHTYGASGYDCGNSGQQTADGGYVLAGNTTSYGSGGPGDVYLVKTDGQGNEQWYRTFGGNHDDFCNSIQQTADGGYVLGGGTLVFGLPDVDFYLVKTDEQGELQWNRTFGGGGDEQCFSVQQTTDGGYVLGGYTNSFGAGNYDFYVVKTDGQGDTLWTRTYGGSSNEYVYSIQQTTDGGYVVAGYTSSFGAGGWDFYVVKTDGQGDTLWTRTYGGSSTEYAYSIQQTTDGGYVVAGWTNSFGAGSDDIYVVKTDGQGNPQWTRTYGGSSWDYAYSIQQTTDGGYVVAGQTGSFGAGSHDFYLVKTAPDPSLLCGSLSGTLSVAYSPYAVTCDLLVPAGDTLVIEPGVRLQFMGPFKFEVRGTLLAVGTETDSIVFTTDLSGDSRWRGLRFIDSTSSGSRLGCCVVERGFARGDWIDYNGGGVWCLHSSPTFANCALRGNSAIAGGGGVACEYSSATFDHCSITDNNGPNYGGGVSLGHSASVFTNCVLSANSALYRGGGVSCIASSPSFIQCVFTGNHVDSDGGGLFCAEPSLPTLTNCAISNNTANSYGGGMFCENGASPSFEGCAFDSNRAYGGGGVFCDLNTLPSFTYCTFIDNQSVGVNGGGGGAYLRSSAPLLNCTFSGNTGQSGGAVYVYNASPQLLSCTMSDNIASGPPESSAGGGAVYCESASPTFIRCEMSGNVTNSRGGGIYCWHGAPVFSWCVMDNNHAAYHGGAVYSNESSPTFANCTMSGNAAGISIGGLASVFSDLRIIATIIAFSTGSGIYFDHSPESQVLYNDFFGNSGGNIEYWNGDPTWGPPGLGQIVTTNHNGDSSDVYFNIFLDPLFVNAANGDFTLDSLSPCIDAGDPTMFDPDCTPSDMGAFYFYHLAQPERLVIFREFPDAFLYWSIVDSTECGFPSPIRSYVIFYEEELGTDWDFLIAVADTFYVHEEVMRYAPSQFYDVIATDIDLDRVNGLGRPGMSRAEFEAALRRYRR